jgi:hypothetical protein
MGTLKQLRCYCLKFQLPKGQQKAIVVIFGRDVLLRDYNRCRTTDSSAEQASGAYLVLDRTRATLTETAS